MARSSRRFFLTPSHNVDEPRRDRWRISHVDRYRLPTILGGSDGENFQNLLAALHVGPLGFEADAFRMWRRFAAVSAPVCGSRQSPASWTAGRVQAIVVLHPVNQNDPPPFPPRGVTGPDGTFVIGLRLTSDGAPEGEYVVTVIWPEEQNPKNPPENTPPDRLEESL